ncbi:MAG: hypothetical protein LBP76_01880 [Treponema sp.]|jgi:hypothetical protein|nr:hypothetical protein [Treponema sp.]
MKKSKLFLPFSIESGQIFRASLALLILCALPVAGQNRQIHSFEDLYPFIDESQKKEVYSPAGLFTSSQKSIVLQFLPSLNFLNEITDPLFKRDPSFFVESLKVIPTKNPVELLAIYNAFRNIRGLKGRLYRSHTRNETIPLFEDATRVESQKKNNPIPDPPAALSIPNSEVIYIRLKDVNFGNTFYRADINLKGQGILYSLSNFKNLSYLFFTVVKEDRFLIQFYIEPLTDGILIYSTAGADVSAFIASKVDMPSAVKKRVDVILAWIIDELHL